MPQPLLARRDFLKLSAAAAALNLGACVSTGDALKAALGDTRGQDQRLAAFFAASFERDVQRAPEFLTYLGRKERYGEWDDYSDTFAVESDAINKAELEELETTFDREALSPSGRVSYDVFRYRNNQRIANFPLRRYNYDVSHFGGPQQGMPAVLINQHRIDDIADAEAYIARIEGSERALDQAVEGMRAAEAEGVTLPRFSYPLIVADARKVTEGAPFGGGAGDCAILADFKAKIGKLDINDTKRTSLIAAAEAALKAHLAPGYGRFVAAVEDIGARVATDHGLSALPKGAEYYAERLAFHTTTAMGADEIHALGLETVRALGDEMKGLKKKLGFSRALKAFYTDLRSNKRYFYKNTDGGRDAYLERARALLAKAEAALPGTFGLLPKARVEVKRMEPFLESGQTIAFYNSPAPDGSRPGYVKMNLSSMAALPKWQMAPLIFHEGIPGHHLQIALAQESTETPEFRRNVFFTAYTEGWGLYSERLAGEMGLYEDVLDEIGRVTMELWRACRLVVDTGIHAKGWSRRKSVEYFRANTALAPENITREIDRYFVYPGQACAYQIGRDRILAVRDTAKAALGDRFALAAFHDTVLKNGAVPLPILEEIVAEWAAGAAKPA